MHVQYIYLNLPTFGLLLLMVNVGKCWWYLPDVHWILWDMSIPWSKPTTKVVSNDSSHTWLVNVSCQHTFNESSQPEESFHFLISKISPSLKANPIILLMVQKSCTSWWVVYPFIYLVLNIPCGAGFLPSTVCSDWNWCSLNSANGGSERGSFAFTKWTLWKVLACTSKTD